MKPVTIGNVEILPLLDTGLLMDPKFFFPSQADKMLREYPGLLDERNLMRVAVTCFLVRSGGKTIMVDSGLGNRRRPRFPRGHLDETLQGAGVAPSDIDLVVHTHLHIDHVGWNTVDEEDGSRRVFFPNATFVIQQTEWDYWMTPERLADPSNEHLVQCVEPLRDTGRIRFVDGELALDQNLTFVPAPGHTPGHVAIGIASAGERAVIIGDASHHPVQLDHPDWSPSADTDPVLSAKTREKLFDDAEHDGRTWLAGHWEHPGVGRIVRLDGRRVFQAL
jgi:glyoxylase-like metal-dependent hydrolase (beta-lactamase superfamily II)